MLLFKLASVLGVFVLVGWLLWKLLGDVAIGEPLVIDGNTLEVKGRRLILFGIDAPAPQQTCAWVKQRVPCGAQARAALVKRLEQASVWCLPKTADALGLHAVCYAGFKDINRWMVSSGWALADPNASLYRSAEERARRHLLGIWALRFTPPRMWRSQAAEKDRRG